MGKNILKDSYKHQSVLNIKVKNIQLLEEILDKIEEKRKELDDALLELSMFNLEINFKVEKDEQYDSPVL